MVPKQPRQVKRLPGSGADSGVGRESGSGDSAGSLTLPGYVYAACNDLMKNGWRMKEIDEMDMLGFPRLRAWDAAREKTGYNRLNQAKE